MLFLLTPVFSQTDSIYSREYLDRSTRFAWLTLGGDLLTFTGGQTEYLQNDIRRSTDFGPTLIPRLTIGGIHFWGHADFYVTFPLSFLTYQSVPEAFSEFSYRQTVETGARVYPLKLKPGRISPFTGISFRRLSFSQEVEGADFPNGAPTYGKFIAPLQFGLTFATENTLLTASAYYQFQDRINYHIAPDQTGDVRLDPVSFQLSFLKYWDTDRSARQAEGVRQLNLKHQVLERENRLSTWYYGLGPSAGLQLSRSGLLRRDFPYLYDDYWVGLAPDLTFGRYFYRPDLNVGLSYRTFGGELTGFDAEVGLRRHSVMLESAKYLFNWLGFAPFAGLTASVENLRVTVNGELHQETKPALGFILGWDIRVTHTGSSLLRTNLRWTPDLHLRVDGERMMFDQLELNFIQWVHFIGRNRAYRKYAD